MAWLRRSWTPEEADDWTKEDLIASILSPLAYIALTIGAALSLLALTIGYIIFLFGIILTLAMYWIIDPKLRKISSEYEKKQKTYLEDLEKIQRWEED
jgi:antibiotic biosynthesis monooxygenase (ABM) superfamily enzyme